MSMIIITIPSYKRPSSLTKLLKAIALASFPMPVRIVVADNDPDLQEAMHVVGNVAPDYPFPLEALLVRARGISAARNALVSHAMSHTEMQWIVMIDDDEWPEPDWIEKLLAAAVEFNANIVGGAVYPIFGSGVPRHIQEHRLYWHKPARSNSFVDRTSNLLLSRSVVETLSPDWFDDRFGLSGGGDHEFLMRAKNAGFRFGNAPDALVYEEVPASRSTAAWLLQRAWRNGNSYAEMTIKHHGFWWGLFLELPKMMIGFFLGACMYAFVFWNEGGRLAALSRMARAGGKLMAFFRVRFLEYVTIHGA